ncbi:hypothetical protein SKAU_G00323970 [Synaphobranchus kaupii]|uniref:Uncharacterized protein n=1 Tax=Synaphobranchus kaupii TaxID=118154 RepID=A0A9Q1EPB0_SYNKA|nr:hypothetical protein SKAU_G00323970 [Synaphobranchus kaupii]
MAFGNTGHVIPQVRLEEPAEDNFYKSTSLRSLQQSHPRSRPYSPANVRRHPRHGEMDPCVTSSCVLRCGETKPVDFIIRYLLVPLRLVSSDSGVESNMGRPGSDKPFYR